MDISYVPSISDLATSLSNRYLSLAPSVCFDRELLCEIIWIFYGVIPSKTVRVGGVAVCPVQLPQAKEDQVCMYAVVPVLDLLAEVRNWDHEFSALLFSMDSYLIHVFVQFDDD